MNIALHPEVPNEEADLETENWRTDMGMGI
jgi:hypothetical protein